MAAIHAQINQTTVSIAHGDITNQTTGAIVNAANSTLMGGGGVDGAIHNASGPAILEECKQIVARQGYLATGKAVITTGGKLKARFVIHTVGPIWHGGNAREAEILASSYQESLKLATEKNLVSIAFPSISTGAYAYPIDKAAKVAVNAVVDFLKEHTTSLREVIFVTFGSNDYYSYISALELMVKDHQQRAHEIT